MSLYVVVLSGCKVTEKALSAFYTKVGFTIDFFIFGSDAPCMVQAGLTGLMLPEKPWMAARKATDGYAKSHG